MSVEGFSAENSLKKDFTFPPIPKPRRKSSVIEVGSDRIPGEHSGEAAKKIHDEPFIAEIGSSRIKPTEFKIPDIKPANSNIPIPIMEVGTTRVPGEPNDAIPNLRRTLDNEPITVGVGLSVIHGEDEVRPVLKEGKTAGTPVLEVGTTRILGEPDPSVPTALRNLEGNPVIGIGLSRIPGERDVKSNFKKTDGIKKNNLPSGEGSVSRGLKKIAKLGNEMRQQTDLSNSSLAREVRKKDIDKKIAAKKLELAEKKAVSALKKKINAIESPLPSNMGEYIKNITLKPEIVHGERLTTKSGVIEDKIKNKEVQKLRSVFIEQGLAEQSLPSVILDRGFEVEMSKTPVQLAEDERRIEKSKPKFFKETSQVADFDTSKDVPYIEHWVEPEKVLSSDLFKPSRTTNGRIYDDGSEIVRNFELEELQNKQKLKNVAESAKLSFVLAYKDLYPGVKDVDEDIIAAYRPPSKWFAFSKAKRNLIDLHKKMMEAVQVASHVNKVGKIDIQQHVTKDLKISVDDRIIKKEADLVSVIRQESKKQEEDILEAKSKKTEIEASVQGGKDLDNPWFDQVEIKQAKENLVSLKEEVGSVQREYADAYRRFFKLKTIVDKPDPTADKGEYIANNAIIAQPLHIPFLRRFSREAQNLRDLRERMIKAGKDLDVAE